MVFSSIHREQTHLSLFRTWRGVYLKHKDIDIYTVSISIICIYLIYLIHGDHTIMIDNWIIFLYHYNAYNIVLIH